MTKPTAGRGRFWRPDGRLADVFAGADVRGGQLGRRRLDRNRLTGQSLDGLQCGPLRMIAKRHGRAVRAGPARAADAMHVVLRVHRQIEVHHVRNHVDVESASRNVGGHQDQRTRRLESRQAPAAGPIDSCCCGRRRPRCRPLPDISPLCRRRAWCA